MQAREVDGVDRAARLALDQLLAVEQIEQARHVPGVGAGHRRQLAHAEAALRPSASARTRRQALGACSDRDDRGTAHGLRSSPRDAMNTVGRSSTSRMLPTRST